MAISSSRLRLVRYALLAIALLGLQPFTVATVNAATTVERFPVIQSYFPQANRFGKFVGKPPAAAVYRDRKLLGYVFLTNDVVRIPAYSGKPINTLVGVDLKGRITGVKIIHHDEPILLAGVTEARLRIYIDQYRGRYIFDNLRIGAESKRGKRPIDTISGATITAMVANSTIATSTRIMAKRLRIPRKAASTSVKSRQPRSVASNTKSDTTTPVVAEYDAAWKDIWRGRAFQIAVLLSSLLLLTVVMLFQDWLVRRPRLYDWVRHGFLVYTVIFIGWYSLAQLSIVNVLTFVHALFHDFRWQTFALDPMIFILWGFVAVTLLMWGRGVYCGWLCPFGAIQELVNHVARILKVRQWEFPYVVHERLWALKYVILILLFGISLQSISEAEYYAEIEPFKTTILLHFQREWGFVVYAIILILISIVNRKFYCKYLCPLGAALVIPAQNRLFNWVRRREECGKPCQVCANECEVQAISPVGEINKNECHYCLDCQVTYWNEKKCPPLVNANKRRHRRQQSVTPPQTT